jgi:hypothetical protein
MARTPIEIPPSELNLGVLPHVPTMSSPTSSPTLEINCRVSKTHAVLSQVAPIQGRDPVVSTLRDQGGNSRPKSPEVGDSDPGELARGIRLCRRKSSPGWTVLVNLPQLRRPHAGDADFGLDDCRSRARAHSARLDEAGTAKLQEWVRRGWYRRCRPPRECDQALFIPAHVVASLHMKGDAQLRKTRTVLDFTKFNTQCPSASATSAEDVATTLWQLRTNPAVCSTDLSDAFHHIDWQVSRGGKRVKVLTKVDKSWYEVTVMPFGWNWAPTILCTALSLDLQALKCKFQGSTTKLTCFMDDVFISADSPASATAAMDEVEAALSARGWTLNPDKRQKSWDPDNPMSILGYVLKGGRLRAGKTPDPLSPLHSKRDTYKAFGALVDPAGVGGAGQLQAAALKLVSGKEWDAPLRKQEKTRLRVLLKRAVALASKSVAWTIPKTGTTLFCDASPYGVGAKLVTPTGEIMWRYSALLGDASPAWSTTHREAHALNKSIAKCLRCSIPVTSVKVDSKGLLLNLLRLYRDDQAPPKSHALAVWEATANSAAGLRLMGRPKVEIVTSEENVADGLSRLLSKAGAAAAA